MKVLIGEEGVIPSLTRITAALVTEAAGPRVEDGPAGRATVPRAGKAHASRAGICTLLCPLKVYVISPHILLIF